MRGDFPLAHVTHAFHRRSLFCRPWTLGLATVVLLLASPAYANVLDHVAAFHIRPESLRQALLDFGRQAHVQIILPETRRASVMAAGLEGRYTERRAVRLLLKGTGLRYAITDHTVEIFPRAETNRGAQTLTDPTDTPSKTSSARKKTTPHIAAAVLHEVVVTGTHLSGGPPPSEPIISITQRDIQASGYQTVEQVMDALPENFNSVGSEQNDFNSLTTSGNIAFGSAVDLMGLGFDSTLVLVNGHRLAPAGLNGAFTDVSVLPLSAIKRIDVVTDGASAIYGADAIGGVVNYILKSALHGGEASAEYGSVTRGGLRDYRLTQSDGVNWRSGHVFFSYEYHDRTPLDALDRPFSVPAAPGELTPGMTQNSFYVLASQEINPSVKLRSQGFYSRRRGMILSGFDGIAIADRARATQFSYALGSKIRVSKDWTVNARVAYGGNNSSSSSLYGTLAGDNRLASASVVANGPIYTLPAGRVKTALGVQVRAEKLSDQVTGVYEFADIHKNRTVEGVFAETEVPLLRSMRGGVPRTSLSMNLAARLDHYSDFGSSFNPRAGIAWTPRKGLRIRGTISSSFKAPNFYELYGSVGSNLVNSPSPLGPAGSSVALLFLQGANPHLKPEKSVEWTAGLDFSPVSIPGLSANVTYYHVDFRDRIAEPGIPLLSALNQGGKYASYIQENPSASELSTLASPPYIYENVTVIPGLGPSRVLSDAVAIADNRLQNIGRTQVRGIDGAVQYVHRHAGFRYTFGLNTAYLFSFKNTPRPGAPSLSVLSTLDNPVDFRGRLRAGVGYARLQMNGFLNYVNHYRDVTNPVPVPVASWTTLDLTASYRLREFSIDHIRSRVTVSCTNCLDRAPPAVRVSSDFLGYDPSNANALGRFLSATVTLRW